MDEYIDKLHIGGKDYDIYAVSATSALSASNAEKLQGLPASTFASAEAFNALSEVVTQNTEDISTLQSYFSDTSAKNAINATSASVAASAAKADALKTAFDLTATNTYGSVSFAGIDGSGNVEGTFTLDVATSLTPTSGSTKAGLAKASDVEDQLAAVEAKIGQIAAFDGPYETTAAIPTPYKTNVIYLVGPSGEGEDKYEEYIAKDGELVKIGTTDAHLSNYYTKSETDSAISTAVATEKTRAEAAETGLDTKINNEVTRATTAEGVLEGKITAEVTRAEAEENEIRGEILELQEDITGHIENTTIHITSTERARWNEVSAMATSAEFTALAGRVTTAEGEIDDLQADMIQAQEDISDVSSTVTGMKYYGKIKIGDLETVATTSADTFEISGGKGIAVTTAVGAGHPTIAISNTAVAPTFTGENGISVTSADNEWTISGKVATSADYGVTKASYVSAHTAFIF